MNRHSSMTSQRSQMTNLRKMMIHSTMKTTIRRTMVAGLSVWPNLYQNTLNINHIFFIILSNLYLMRFYYYCKCIFVLPCSISTCTFSCSCRMSTPHSRYCLYTSCSTGQQSSMSMWIEWYHSSPRSFRTSIVGSYVLPQGSWEPLEPSTPNFSF